MKKCIFMRFRAMVLTVILLLSSLGLQDVCADETADVASYTAAETKMGFKYGSLLGNKKNAVYCPYGLASAIGMLSGGMEEGSAAYNETMKMFDAGSASALGNNNRAYLEGAVYGSDNISRSVSFLLVDQTNGGADGVVPAFREFAQNNYNATVRTADFRNDLAGEKEKIKQDVNTVTDGFIPDYVSSAREDTDVDLMNVTYFKGRWKYTLEKKNTQKRKFTNVNGKVKKVKMMQKDLDEKVRYYQDKNFRAVMLPYSDKAEEGSNPDEVYMVVILPKNKKDTDCVKRWNKTSEEYKTKFLSKLEKASTYNNVDLRLPRFDMDMEFDLSDILKKMGLGSVFAPGSRITAVTGTELALTGAVQRTRIKVDEEGTTAAAVTEFVMKNTSVNTHKKPYYKFYCNVPFVFMIRDGAGMTLFAGAVNKL